MNNLLRGAGTGPSLGPLDRYKGLVDDWPAFAECALSPLPQTVWANRLRVEPARLPALLADVAVEAEPLPWLPDAFVVDASLARQGIGRTWPYLAGLLHVQEAVSMIPVELLDVRPGMRVLDLCAAPGNKTAQIAVRLANRGTVVANDPYVDRLRALRQNLDRLGMENVSVTRWDGASLPAGVGRFDRVLVDAPCSCEGTTRKNKRLLESGISPDRNRLARTQRDLLRRALTLLRPGGRLVYSTCTYAPEENELVVHTTLEGRDDLRLLPARLPGLRSEPGITRWRDEALHPDLRRTMRVWPHHNDTGGFFVAVLERMTTDPPAVFAPDPRPPRADADAARWRSMLIERYGLPDSAFAGRLLVRRRREGLHLLSADHRPPGKPAPEASGLYLLRTDPRYPKPTTEGAMAFGALATRNVVDLDPTQTASFLGRRDTVLDAQTGSRCPSGGYVIVRHGGFPLGVGVWLPGEGGTGEGRLVSQYPKALSPQADRDPVGTAPVSEA